MDKITKYFVSSTLIILILYLFTSCRIQKSTNDLKSQNSLKIGYNLFNYAGKIKQKYGSLIAIDSVLSLSNEYLNDSASFQNKSFYYQVLMTYYSFISDYKKSLYYESLAFNKTFRIDSSLTFDNYYSIPAKKRILDVITNQNIVLFNEAHNRPANRTFVTSVLKELKNKGFDYLAVEGLGYKDSLLLKRGGPLQSSGYYIGEPAFGELIREAIKLNFKIVAYEDTSKYDANLDNLGNRNKRELGQANNISNILKTNPKAKIIVYAGHAHIYKKNDDGWKKMAEWLSERYKSNIISFDCTTMKESYTSRSEFPAYQKIIKSFSDTIPFILVDKNDKSNYIYPKLKGKVDCSIIFPKTTYVKGYPNWMITNNSRFYKYDIPKKLRSKDLFFQIFSSKEWKSFGISSVPLSQLNLNSSKSNVELLLPGNDNSYILIIYDIENKSQYTENILF